jgi:uncharacterized protein YijF (DUF1287 family)
MKTPSSLRSFISNALWLALCLALVWHFRSYVGLAAGQTQQEGQRELAAQARSRLPRDDSFATKLAHASLDRTMHVVRYEPAYVPLAYPGGDVPGDTGVCTDEVIRAYRALGFDLQKEVHEDMKQNFSAYPRQWGLSRPDANIDHRRVPNLRAFFKRRGASLPVTDKPEDFLPGDLITCTVPPHLPHIGLVVPAPDGGPRPWIVHNIGHGPRLEDRLFEFPLTGHYRWHPKAR